MIVTIEIWLILEATSRQRCYGNNSGKMQAIRNLMLRRNQTIVGGYQ